MAKRLPVLEGVPADFYGEHVLPRRPVVLRGAARGWPAVGKWTPAHLKEVVGHKVLALSADNPVRTLAVGEYLDRLDAAPRGAPLPYLRNVFLHVALPELSPDVEQPAWIQPNWLEVEPLASLIRAVSPQWLRWCELFISGPGTRFPFVHIDRHMTHAWCVQIFGRKQYFAWPPRPGFQAADCRDRYLEVFFDTEPFLGTLDPGDAIFIPAGWPHTAQSVTTSIGVSGSWVNESNWREFSDDFFATKVRSALLRG
jgi:histone arginine demethylase JMJD6